MALSESARLRFSVFTLLYAAQGLGWGIFVYALPAWYAEAGASAAETGAFIFTATLPWSIKLLIAPVMDRYPGLRVVLEHITTEDAVAFVRQGGDNLAATITAHHLLLNRNALFQGGLRPHAYCLPVVKRERHRQALLTVRRQHKANIGQLQEGAAIAGVRLPGPGTGAGGQEDPECRRLDLRGRRTGRFAQLLAMDCRAAALMLSGSGPLTPRMTVACILEHIK